MLSQKLLLSIIICHNFIILLAGAQKLIHGHNLFYAMFGDSRSDTSLTCVLYRVYPEPWKTSCRNRTVPGCCYSSSLMNSAKIEY